MDGVWQRGTVEWCVCVCVCVWQRRRGNRTSKTAAPSSGPRSAHATRAACQPVKKSTTTSVSPAASRNGWNVAWFSSCSSCCAVPAAAGTSVVTVVAATAPPSAAAATVVAVVAAPARLLLPLLLRCAASGASCQQSASDRAAGGWAGVKQPHRGREGAARLRWPGPQQQAGARPRRRIAGSTARHVSAGMGACGHTTRPPGPHTHLATARAPRAGALPCGQRGRLHVRARRS